MAETIEWLPILAQLGEDVVARILDSSPDAKTAILQAREEFQKAQTEGEDLLKKGHEDE